MGNLQLQRIFNRARLDDRLVNELIGLCRGMLADKKISQEEAEYIQKWLVANRVVSQNPVIAVLLDRVNTMLADNVLDEDESSELLETLEKFVGGDYELGELTKSTSLPLNDPPPEVVIEDRYFCFTGTFAFGSRRECEKAVVERSGQICNMTKKTDYLVIGCYATDSWAHSSYGRKIEKAATMRSSGHKIAIIGEQHWLTAIDQP